MREFILSMDLHPKTWIKWRGRKVKPARVSGPCQDFVLVSGRTYEISYQGEAVRTKVLDREPWLEEVLKNA